MSKCYVSEKELKEFYLTLYDLDAENDFRKWEFQEWIEGKVEKGEVERVEFNYYEISNLKY